jgi:diguanylate cyclase (GGDEF)-like protein
MTIRRPHPLYVYLAAVAVTGWTVLLMVLVHGHGLHVNAEVVILGCLVVAGEVFPIRLPHGEGEFTTSTTFAYALLLCAGPVAAIVALMIGSAITDLKRSRSVWKLNFNIGQYSLALCASAGVLALLDALPSQADHFKPSDLPAILAGGAVFFAINNAAAGTASALAEGDDVLSHLRLDFADQFWTAAMLLGLAPIVVVAADFSVLLLPWLLLPMAAVYRSGQATLFRHQALHDVLTGLPNRELFREQAEQALRVARRTGGELAIVAIDLDGFKQINDSLGHARGDELLQAVGPRLQESTPEDATIARLGGDEFVLLLPGCGEHEARAIAERALADVRRPFVIEELPVEVGASLGIASYPAHGEKVTMLAEHADVALYRAKRRGTGVEVWVPGEAAASKDVLTLAVGLRRAIECSELELHYQPAVDMRTGDVRGVEALVRWNDPLRGMIGPDDFVALAEQTGLISALTEHVLETALRDRSVWRADGMSLGVSVNLSASVLDQGLPDLVATKLAAHDTPPSALTLELTETHAMADPTAALSVLGRLAELGVHLSVDDYGTGHSSLAYLKRLPVSEMKIDKSFVMSMTSSASDATIVRSTVELGRDLGLTVVAEGVETREVWDMLAARGCELAQGYFIARPMPAADLVPWVTQAWADSRPAPVVTALPVRAASA